MIRRGIGVQSYVSAGGAAPVDADAQAFITAAGITDATQQSAINTLVTDLKGYGIWTKMIAIYPFVGGTSSTHKWNLKDPRDLDAAFRLVFSGGWTHSSNGATPNGTNGFANTYCNPQTQLGLQSNHLSHYSRTQVSNTNTHDMGCETGTGLNFNLFQYYSAITNKGFNDGAYPTNAAVSNTTNTLGLAFGTRQTNTSLKLFFNGSNLNTNTNAKSATNYPNFNIYIGATNSNNTAAAYSNRQCAFASIGDGLTDTEAANLYTSVQKYQTTLGRSVGTQTVSDSDAQAFVNAAVIEDQVQATAINTLVTDLKGYGIWTKMKAIYPFVGGTSSAHKWNLKDPRDLDAAFRLVFNGGATHSSTGYLPNGTNGYSNTFLTPSANLSNNSTHLSFYSRTNFNGSPGGDIGTSGASPSFLPIALIYTRAADFLQSSMYDYDSAKRVSTSNTNSTGFYVGNRTSNVILNSWKNGVKQATNTTAETQNITTVTNPFFVGAINLGGSAGQYSNKECAFASIGDGLTDTEAANLYSAVQAYQTTLNRNV